MWHHLVCSRLRDSGEEINAERKWKKIARELGRTRALRCHYLNYYLIDIKIQLASFQLRSQPLSLVSVLKFCLWPSERNSKLGHCATYHLNADVDGLSYAPGLISLNMELSLCYGPYLNIKILLGTTGVRCRDNDRRCTRWAYSGECRRNPRYMLIYCKKSCRQC